MNSPAYDVNLEDEWSPEEFEIMSGLQSGSWARIPAPYSYGYKTSSSARVTYKNSLDGPVQIAKSNDLGLLPVLSSKDDDKLSDPHMLNWFVFLVGSLAMAFLPLFLCRPPQSQDGQNSKKAKKA